ncbi:MAG: membrane-bound lytic murein transglycosylase A [Rickettsiales bacterium]|jgi:membrane-bound lytic murein transglycosylase A
MIKKILTLTFILTICACTFTTLVIKGKGDIRLRQVEFVELSGWNQDKQIHAVKSLINSCNQFAKMPRRKQIGNQIGNILVEDFKDVCDISRKINSLSSAQARNFFENWFVPFEVSNRSENDRGLFTGYYVPELHGSRFKNGEFQYPVYSKPRNNSDFRLTRKQIEEGALENEGLEILYVNDPVDLFFMQVQGSGKVILDDGEVVNLGFGGKTRHKYSSIGKYIIRNNVIESGDVSYFSIKNWLKNNPDEAREVMHVNKSYIFFQESVLDQVVGSQGAPLIAQRSLAVDNEIMPTGFPIWLDINVPARPYQKLVVSQDTGSAIKGAVRGDVFFGRGKAAENLAARMNHRGKYYILLPTAAVDRMVGR